MDRLSLVWFHSYHIVPVERVSGFSLILDIFESGECLDVSVFVPLVDCWLVTNVVNDHVENIREFEELSRYLFERLCGVLDILVNVLGIKESQEFLKLRTI